MLIVAVVFLAGLFLGAVLGILVLVYAIRDIDPAGSKTTELKA